MAANNKYSIIGRYAQGREIIAFELANLGTNAHQRYTVNQVAYLVGRGSVLNCQGQIYNGKVLFRGVGCSLDQLPTVMEKPVEELNGAEAPIKNTENISGPARRNATNDQLMGQMTLVARVKVEETSKKTLGYDFKNVGGTTGTLWRGEVLKAAREGKITNARVNSANGKEILRSRGTTPEEQLSSLPIRIATPEELKKLGVKVESPEAKAQNEKNRAEEISKIAGVYKGAIDDVIFDLDTRGIAYSIVDVNREVIPEAELNSIELYEDFLKAQVLGTFMIIRLKTKQGYMAELSFDVDSNETYNKKPSYVITSAMLVKKEKSERPRNAGKFSITLDNKTDKNDIYLKTMSLISKGLNYNENDFGDKLINLSKSLFNYLKSVVDERVLPETKVHGEFTEDENYAESTLRSMAKDIEKGEATSCSLSYKLTNTATEGIKNTTLGIIEATYANSGTFSVVLRDSKHDKVSESKVEMGFSGDIESTDIVVKETVDSLNFNLLNIETVADDKEINWAQIEQNLIAVKEATEDYLDDEFRNNKELSGYFLFTKNGQNSYSNDTIKELIETLKSGKKHIDFEYKFMKDISGEDRARGYISVRIEKGENEASEFVVKATLYDQNHFVFLESSTYTLDGYPNLCTRITEEALDEVRIGNMLAKSNEKLEAKLARLYNDTVKIINKEVAKYGLKNKFSSSDEVQDYIKLKAEAMLETTDDYADLAFNIVNIETSKDVGKILINFDMSDKHRVRLDAAYASGQCNIYNDNVTRTDLVVSPMGIESQLLNLLFINNFDFSIFSSDDNKAVEAFASLVAIGVNAIYGLRVPGLDTGAPVIRYSDTNGVKVLTEGNGLEQGNFPGGFDVSEDIINKACEAASNGADTVKVSVTTRFYNLDFIVKNNNTFRIVYMDNSNRKSKLIATKEQTIMLDDVDAFEPVMTAAYQSALQVLLELQPLMQEAVDSGEEFE